MNNRDTFRYEMRVAEVEEWLALQHSRQMEMF